MTEPAVLLEAALKYVAREWAVFPVHTMRGDRCTCGDRDCSSPGKHPHTKQGLHDATIDETQVREWWKRWPHANIGVATGEVSALVVVDVDGMEGESSLEELEAAYEELPDTARAITGGDGLHYLFAHPGENMPNTARKLGPGLDTRGDGGYIVVPPSMHRSGQRYEWLDERPPAPLPGWLLQLLREPAPRAPAPTNGRGYDRDGTPYGLEALEREVADLRGQGEGNRNHQLNKAAFSLGQLVAGGELDEGLVIERLAGVALAIGLAGRETERTIRSGLDKGRQQPRTAPEREKRGYETTARPTPPEKPPAVDDESGGETRDGHLTDLGNARRLVATHGADFRFVPQWNTWLTWTGTRWRRDVTGEIDRRAKRIARDIGKQAFDQPHEQDRKKLLAWALKSESESRLRAMVSVAETEPSMPVEPHELDADPWALVVENGTIDLRTGQLREHRREDLATKKVAVAYDADARLEMWEQFLHDATNGDEELQDFLQRAVGYSLTGRTDEEVLFFVHGPAAAGKSTFMDAIQMTLGDYAATADFQTFLEQKGGGGNARSDVARLAGARFVKSVEVSEGQKLAEGLVKNLTGGDVITARFLYQNEFEFRPAFKLWLAANAAPRIDHEDEAIWRRILRVPFEHVVPKDKRDPNVKATLRDPERAGPAILAWAVRGCLEWQQRRLNVPRVVEEATRALRAEMDPLADWLEDRCVLDPDQWVLAEHLWDAYRTWTKAANAYTLSRKSWAKKLANRGPSSGRMRVDGEITRVWRGIGLQHRPEDHEMPSDARALTRADGSGEVDQRAGADWDPDQELFDSRALTRADDAMFQESPRENDSSEKSSESALSARVSARGEGDDAGDSAGIMCSRCGSDDRVMATAEHGALCKACRLKVGEELLEEDGGR